MNQPKPYRPSYGANAQPQPPTAPPPAAHPERSDRHPGGPASPNYYPAPPPAAPAAGPAPSYPSVAGPAPSYPPVAGPAPSYPPAPGSSMPPQPYPPQFAGAAQQEEPKATLALILGVVSVLCLGAITGIPAVIIARGSKKNIDASGGTLGGRGKAVAGEILGWIGIAYFLVSLLFVILSLAAR